MELIIGEYAYIVNDDPIKDGDRAVDSSGNLLKEGVKEGLKIIASDDPTLDLPDVRFDLSFQDIRKMVLMSRMTLNNRPRHSFDYIAKSVALAIKSGTTFYIVNNKRWIPSRKLLPKYGKVVDVITVIGTECSGTLISKTESSDGVKLNWKNALGHDIDVEYWSERI